MEYYAHVSEDGSHRQLLRDHVQGVAQLARRFAAEALPGDADFAETAFFAGLLHDLGKYREEFQRLIRNQCRPSEQTRHKQAGAAVACNGRRMDLGFAIAGHHTGVPDCEKLRQLILDPGGNDVADRVLPLATRDCPALAQRLPPWPYGNDRGDFDVMVRLLVSCLVDADWSDTNEFHRRARGQAAVGEPHPLDAPDALAHVLDYIEQRAARCGKSAVAAIRHEVLQAALQAAKAPGGLFQMTVPTGGAKTLSSLAFALAHAAEHGLRRIIYVAPYLSIIEQNAREIRGALAFDDDGDRVFEHHSLVESQEGTDDDSESSETLRLAENWGAPVIITTSVQFFESLFAARPAACRKLHNIARSVVILDECQTLPPGLIQPTCDLLSRFAEVAGCTMVFCTATQPAWTGRADLPEGLQQVRNIVSADLNLFERLRRVHVCWPETRNAGLSWDAVADQLQPHRSALCVVNTRAAARELFTMLRDRGCPAVFHLSTWMCPAHRLVVLDEVRRRLDAGEPCHLISTQLIEAGVDVDFPVVFREMAPLESIIQAAGRCNREGRLAPIDGQPGGRVVVFRNDKSTGLPDPWYKAGIAVVEQDFLAAGRVPDIGQPDHVCEYFRRLYKSGELDAHHIQEHRRSSNFAEVASLYRLIEQDAVSVVATTWEPARPEIERLLRQWRDAHDRRALRQLSRYQVNLRRYDLGRAADRLTEEPGGLRVWWGQYDADVGLDLDGNVDLPPV